MNFLNIFGLATFCLDLKGCFDHSVFVELLMAALDFTEHAWVNDVGFLSDEKNIYIIIIDIDIQFFQI